MRENSTPQTEISTADPKPLYFCPGESHPIEHSVHLARLAAFYSACFSCPLRHQTGHLPAEVVARFQASEARRPRQSLVTPFGLRGVYLNELNRFHAAALVNSFVKLRAEGSWSSTILESLTLVIGYQEHPAAPDLMVGIVNALRASGVQIVDAGLTTGPLLSYTIATLQAEGGVLITGAGCDPAGIGLDFFLNEGIPLSDRDDLLSIESQREASTFRLPKAQGGYQTCDKVADYLAQLRVGFHALRPLRVCLGTSLTRIVEFTESLFEPLPCSLELVSLPRRRRDLMNEGDLDHTRVGERVRQTSSHLGIVIDDDGRSCALIDERGEWIPAARWIALLEDHFKNVRHEEVHHWTGSHTTLPQEMARQQMTLGTSPEGRIWFGQKPRCDGLVTLSLILEALSRSDRELSERVV